MLTENEAKEVIDAEIERVLDDNPGELYHVFWDYNVGYVKLLWNSPLIEDTELDFEPLLQVTYDD